MNVKCSSIDGWEVIEYEPRVCVNKNKFGDFIVLYSLDGKNFKKFWDIPGLFYQLIFFYLLFISL